MQNVTNPTVKTHVVWLDVVRLIACLLLFAVIVQTRLISIPEILRLLGILSFGELPMGLFFVLVYLCSL